MAEEFDPWATGSGLLTNYDGTIIDTWFAMEATYHRLNLHVKFLIDGDEKDEFEERYSVGGDWNTFDGGKTCEHPKGDKQAVNKSSGYGQFLTRALEAGGEKVLRQRGTPRNAEVWLGTRWHMDEVEQTFNIMNEATGKREPTTSTKNFPSKFLGLANGDTPTATTPKAAASGNSEPLADDETLDALKTLAKEHSHSEWVDKAMDLTGVLSNDKLVTALADEQGLYTQLKG